MKVIVNVYLKDGVLDPQGKAVEHALGVLGYNEVKEARIGKQIILTMESCDNADEKVRQMCETLLANTVIEDYNYEILS